ncbi:hypothetical protein [Gluconobacter wancherniae]|uniref:Uncharacterized protein n=1 Tax=Gluconobacter wancherniae NBRC 103581 TaxID=656744 RepID=A0A511AYT6_9PROT|nr:hypothetical protein [Gluconobacter wancherniae]MBF0853531.1 hypothetical protein [Gluconobacter wancherniae]GBD55724.1 hypothetical protein NBRC103581_00291 [Gluconobacter wancherniae NBRC 103581]GBR66246.1 hypothetical protein AA103581_2252 [Gluconobacter wancherniae NBRC 103581]GEK93369.1 hypothetical protein GWA01_11390 [Gluconobacter wancherniae NBRC 103581]
MDLSGFLNEIPARYELWVALFIIACKLITVFVRPPKDSSCLAAAFQFVSLIGLNVGWAANRLEAGRTRSVPPGKIPAPVSSPKPKA